MELAQTFRPFQEEVYLAPVKLWKQYNITNTVISRLSRVVRSRDSRDR